MDKYIYPSDIRELKEGDNYQMRVKSTDNWEVDYIYSSNICVSKKNYIKFLITNKRLRIIKDE